MMRRFTTFLLLLSALIMMVGCSGDMVKSVLANGEMKAKLMDAIAGDNAVSGEVLDKLMGSEGTREQAVEKILGNGDMMQALMGRISKDQTMVDGIMATTNVRAGTRTAPATRVV